MTRHTNERANSVLGKDVDAGIVIAVSSLFLSWPSRVAQSSLTVQRATSPKALEEGTSEWGKSITRSIARSPIGLLPELELSIGSLFGSVAVNFAILALVFIIGLTAKHVIEKPRFEHLVMLGLSNPRPAPKAKSSEAPELPPPPKMPEVRLDHPRTNILKPEPKPELKPIQMEAKVTLPVMKATKVAVILTPQPKQALATAAVPAQVSQARPSTASVHFGNLQGVTPNPNVTQPAIIAAIGNPYGGLSGPATAPRGVVGSTGFGDGIKSGSSAVVVGKVASVGIPAVAASVPVSKMVAFPVFTNLEVLSKSPVQYTSEAKQFKVQGDVILRVTFTASGKVIIKKVVHGLGHGLDEEACRVAQQIRFHPATRNGQTADLTTNITITFQLS